MDSPIGDCPTWQRYLEVVAAVGGMPNNFPQKSALYQRLRDGKQPLVLPPPLNHSYPWYEVVETDRVFAPLDEPCQFEPFDEYETDSEVDAVLIEQTAWLVLERISDQEMIVTQPGWRELGFKWRYWFKPTPASESDVSLISHYSPGCGRITTSAQLDLECQHQANQWKSLIELALSDWDEEAKLLSIDPGIEPSDRTQRGRMRLAAAKMSLESGARNAGRRQSQGKPPVPDCMDVEAYAIQYRANLLDGCFREEDGQLFVDGWALQRIAPSALGPEHYLPGVTVEAGLA
ncbi:hypothetical protein IIE18_10500 [Pseudomonas sp. V1]|uniref:hypothetical protein n=1 Tax=Pseudomonas arcuscaelestis TaxID=2710591 RepID=UPI00193F59E6|nr:hypothetical protein [Pseudomonas arcuscaelestis]MBM3105569.1 hypothetical protein [Pseudomonas arcuscaelestis]